MVTKVMARLTWRRYAATGLAAFVCALLGHFNSINQAAGAAKSSVYYTDYYGVPRIRPVIIDGTPNVRAGLFRDWRGWGTATATATARRGVLHTTVKMQQIRFCRGRRQYRLLTVSSYEGRQLLARQRYTNRQCRKV